MVDERECRKRIKDDPLVERLFLGEGPVYHESNWPLVDATGAILGHGEIAVAALWDGKQVRGFVSADSLLGHAPITAPLQELLVLFSSSIGHLVALQLAQEEARTTAEFHRRVLQGLQAAVVVHAADTRIVMSNQMAADLLGVGEEEMAGKRAPDPAWDFVDEDGTPMVQRDYPVNAVLRTRNRVTDLLVGIKHHGPDQTVWVVVNAFPLLSPDSTVEKVVVTFTDVSARRRMEEERRELETQILQAQKLESLGALAGGIAHDFNNLLVGILGNADLALDLLPADHRGQTHLAKIKEAATHASDLANQMLAYSGKGRFIVEPVSINAVVDDMAMLLRSSVAKNVSLAFDLADDLPLVDADELQIRQLIMNLITNASDAIGKAAGAVTVRTTVADVSDGGDKGVPPATEIPPGACVSVTVVDDGCGMDETTKRRLFEPFFTTQSAGRGLGMAAVLGIVRGHHAAIQVESKPGVGTTVTVLLPVSACPPSSVSVYQTSAPGTAEPVARGGTVLVIDDERSMHFVASELLRKHGFVPLMAANGKEGIELFNKHAEEIVTVFLDLTMPDMNGHRVFDELRRRDPAVRVILCSGYSEREASRDFSDSCLAGFLKKPFKGKDFVAKLS
ncbi:MAG: response regulator [Lentisphaerae bacterium]|nr:response regulator [Lentisphaerota bacterium]MBT5609685.1 response regulator [Lentisphaerota bacterium]MBT7054809.1 response regulator [Lentisphaerota bacterium]MBT7840918.1 response regulator [Lentisphaerota bacterium]